MNLSEQISNIIFSRSQELYFLLQFVRDIDTYILHRPQQRANDIFAGVPDRIKSELMQYFGEFIEFGKKVAKEVEESKPTEGKRAWVFKPEKSYPREVQQHLIPLLVALYRPIRYPDLLYNMALTHAIAIFESFLSDFLVAIFTLRPNTLKSANTATYEDILSFSSMKQLINQLANSRANKILSGNIYEVADDLKKLFSIDISGFDKFAIIHEAFCRRHIIVHNDSITDRKYCEKIPSSQIGVRLSTDFQYIETLFTTIGQFIDYLDGCFSRKMRYKRNPIVNQLLNPPDSVGGLLDSS